MTMRDKARRRALAKKYTEAGLPIDGRDWTEADWRDLHEALETIKRKVSERHADERRNSLRPLPPTEPDAAQVGV